MNADRAARHEAEFKRQARLRRHEESTTTFANPMSNASTKPKKQTSHRPGGNGVNGLDHAGSPSSEASEDVAAVGHAPETLDQKMRERSKYEAAEPFRSRKGDRLS